MSLNSDKVLLPQDVRKLLNIDNREIVELCKQTSVTPKKDQRGQIYFSVEEVKKLKNAKASAPQMGERKKMTLPVMTKPNSQAVVNGLLETLNKMENTMTTNITSSMTKIIDEKLEGMDDVVLELVRCKTENENLKNKVNELNKENFKLRNTLSSFKPLMLGFFIKKEEEPDFML